MFRCLLVLLAFHISLTSATVADFLLICNSGACEIKNTVSSVEENLDFSQYNKLNFTDLTTVKKITFINSTFRSFSAYLLTAMPNLAHIIAKNCGIQDIDVQVFGPNTTGNANHLETLVLSDNKMNALVADTLAAAVNLRELFLTNNSIERIHERAFGGLGKLEHLDLGYNRLKQIELHLFTPLMSLKRILLHNNLLETIDLCLFGNNAAVEFLSLENNLLFSISTSAPIPLERLLLAGNQLSSFDVQNLSSLKEVDLAKNNWNCSHLLEVLEVFGDLGIKLPEGFTEVSDKPTVKGIGCTISQTSCIKNDDISRSILEYLMKFDIGQTENKQTVRSLEGKMNEIGKKLSTLESNMMIMFRHLMNIQPEREQKLP